METAHDRGLLIWLFLLVRELHELQLLCGLVYPCTIGVNAQGIEVVWLYLLRLDRQRPLRLHDEPEV